MPDSRRIAVVALWMLPAGLVAFFAFNSGGFYPGPPAYVAMVVCVVLALRAAMAQDPLEGLSWPLALAAGALAAYAVLALLSESWSHAPGRAVVEFDLPLLYLLVMVLFGSVARTRARVEWVLRALAGAIVVVCVCGLVTRVVPDVWHTSSTITNNRLSFPITYWNALGLLAVLGVVLCIHLTSELREPRASRILAAAALPALVSTLFFTFSRGSMAVGAVAVLAYLLLGRPRGLPSALLAVVPTTAVAIVFDYGANLLATPDPTTPAATHQGHHVAIAVGACVMCAALARAALLPLDRRLERIRLRDRTRRRVARLGWGSAATVAVVLIAAFNGAIAHEYHRFTQPGGPGNAADLRTRLTDPENNGRLDMWRVALHQFEAKPLVGAGAGTFANTWAQKRPTGDFVQDSHSLYMETLDELGIVGLLLLLTVIVTVLVRTLTHARGPDRAMYAAVFAVLLAWALHAGVDWDWEMPVLTVVFFSLGGLMLARPLGEASVGRSGLAPYRRTLVGLACVLLGVAPGYVWLSQRKLNQASEAFAARDCRMATRAADASISILGIRAEPYEILAYCDARRKMPARALAAIDKAASLDPQNWNYAYDQAVIRAAAGLDPRAAAREALKLDPLEQFTQDAWRALGPGTTAGERQRFGQALVDSFTTL